MFGSRLATTCIHLGCDFILWRWILFRNGQLSSCLKGEVRREILTEVEIQIPHKGPIAGQSLTSLIYSDRFESAKPPNEGTGLPYSVIHDD